MGIPGILIVLASVAGGFMLAGGHLGVLLQPSEFITLAAQAQMSIPLDRAVIHRAFEWLAANPKSLAATWRCSINLTGATMEVLSEA